MEPPTEVGGRERVSSVSPLVTIGGLQWSRRPKSAEGGVSPIRGVNHLVGFNGAADRSRRKVEERERDHERRERASMEPPTEVGGRVADRLGLVGDAHALQWSRRPKSAEGLGERWRGPRGCSASMEPPTEVGGRPSLQRLGSVLRSMLQWSRRPKSAEGRSS